MVSFCYIETNATCARVEVQGALAQDLEPSFPQPVQWLRCARLAATASQTWLDHEQFSSWVVSLPNNSELIAIYHALFVFSRETSFDEHNPRIVSSPYSGAWTNALIHRLLSMRPLRKGNSPGYALEEVCRIASLLYLIPIWRSFGVSPVRSGQLVGKLRVILSCYSICWTNLESLHMWILYMGCVEALRDDLGWFLQETESWMECYGLESWDVLRQSVKSVLWIDNVFPVVGQLAA